MKVAWRITPGAVFAATPGAKTFLLAIAPAGFGLQLVDYAVSFDGVTGSAVPAAVDIVTSTQATAGTSGAAAGVTRVRGRTTGGHVPTAGSNYTAEPTVLTVVAPLYVAQFMGLWQVQGPLGREMETDSSAGTTLAIGLRINVSANVNVKGYLEVEAIG